MTKSSRKATTKPKLRIASAATAPANLAIVRLRKIVKRDAHYRGDLSSSTVSCLLADLRHACDALGLDFAERDQQGRSIYLGEIAKLGVAKPMEA